MRRSCEVYNALRNSGAVKKTIDINETLDLDGKKTRKRRAGCGAIVLLILAAATTSLVIFGRESQQQTSYQVEPVERGDLIVTVGATGTLEPMNVIDLGIEVSGTIRSVEVDANDSVEKGQVMAEIDTTRLEAMKEQSEAALASAEAKVLLSQASVKEAEARFQRLQHVHEVSNGRIPSQDELESAEAYFARSKAEEASARASAKQAEATLNVNLTDLSKAVIRAPIDGVVLRRHVEPGQTVAATFQAPLLITMAEDLSEMELRVDVDEADVGLVKEGQDATFTVDAYPDVLFEATITQVNFGSDTVDGVVTYSTALRVDNSEMLLRPGMTATATIVVEDRKAVKLVPNRAFRFTPARPEKQNKRGGMLGGLIPRPPFGNTLPNNDESENVRRIWTLENWEPVEQLVRIGRTDGTHTEVLGDELSVGAQVILGLDPAAGSER